MTRLGWISAVLFFAQAAIALSAISEFSRQADSSRSMAYECGGRPDCAVTYSAIHAEAKSAVTYAWIGLALGSALTLFGVWKGYRDARR
jgi:hypothetical protein